MKLNVLLIVVAVILVGALTFLGGQAVEQSRTTPENAVSTTSTQHPVEQSQTTPENAVSTTSSQYPIEEIYSIENRVSDYLMITRVKKKTDYLEVIIELKYQAQYEPEGWTEAIAGETVKILNQHGLKTDVLVWAYVRSNGEDIILGNTRYDSGSGSYTFEEYQ